MGKAIRAPKKPYTMKAPQASSLASDETTETKDARVLGVRESGNAGVALGMRPGSRVHISPADEPTATPRVWVYYGNYSIGRLSARDSAWALRGLEGASSSLQAVVKSVRGSEENPEMWITMVRRR